MKWLRLSPAWMILVLGILLLFGGQSCRYAQAARR